jgi:serine O-acetyltransferase
MGLWADARSIAKRDPAAKGLWQVVLLYPGFHILVNHRLAHGLYRAHLHFLARWVSQCGRFWTGIEIHPGAKLGSGLFIDHGIGVVIGETAEVGDDCTIYQNVTLGGTGKHKGKRHPTLGNRVLVGVGAQILGPFKVGDNAMIGANAVVLSEVPEGATVVGVPGRMVKLAGAALHNRAADLDQTEIPDPVYQELCRIMHRIAVLERQVGKQNGRDCPEPGIPTPEPAATHLED